MRENYNYLHKLQHLRVPIWGSPRLSLSICGSLSEPVINPSVSSQRPSQRL